MGVAAACGVCCAVPLIALLGGIGVVSGMGAVFEVFELVSLVLAVPALGGAGPPGWWSAGWWSSRSRPGAGRGRDQPAALRRPGRSGRAGDDDRPVAGGHAGRCRAAVAGRAHPRPVTRLALGLHPVPGYGFTVES